MTVAQVASSAAAVAIVAWPWLQSAVMRLKATRAPAARRTAGYEEAIHNLAVVRSRLVATSLLGEEQKKAIDTLTLALVAGSDS